MNATDFALRVVDALERRQVSYMFVGSFSSNAWGIPRSTKDADFVIELGDMAIGDLAAGHGAGSGRNPRLVRPARHARSV